MNTSIRTNSLTSHSPERSSQRVDKMGGWFSKFWVGTSKKFPKKFTNKKRRQLFKQNNEEKF